jgi:hypothetical protein
MLMNREFVGFSLLGIVCVIAVLSTTGASTLGPCGDGCGLEVIGDPAGLLGTIAVGILMFIYRPSDRKLQRQRPVRIWRRLLAFLIDYFVSLMMIFPIIVSTFVASRYFVTGDWAWTFQLAPGPTTNLISFLSIASVLILLYLYFWLHSQYGRATLGQYIMGFQIMSDGDYPRFGWSPFFAFIAICSWHLWIWFKKDEDARTGQYWWDRAAGTRAFMVSP